MKRNANTCREQKCTRFERLGTPPANTTNYLCLYADARRFETKAEFEAQEMPDDCPFIKLVEQSGLEVSELKYSLKPGDLVVIMITGMLSGYIAEITQEEPLRMKVEEKGPLAHLKHGDYIILRAETEAIQEDGEAWQSVLRVRAERGRPLRCGLRSVGIEDGQLHEILPLPIAATPAKTG